MKFLLQPSRGVDTLTMVIFAIAVLTMPVWLTPFGAGYPDLVQKFAIYGLFATGFNLLFGLTGYLSFGHAAFLGIGSYTAVWTFKLLGMNPIPAVLLAIVTSAAFALVIGYISLRRSGIYFSILTLAFAQMSYQLAYSVLTPITNGETGLRVLKSDPRVFEGVLTKSSDDGPLVTNLFGLDMTKTWNTEFLGMDIQLNAGFYFCAFFLILGSYIAVRIFRSPFGMMLRGVKTNQNRMNYTGLNTRPYTLAAFVISGAYAGLAGALLCVTDPLAGAERMFWTASGEVVLMVILGGAGTIMGPMLGAGIIKYFENILSAFNHATLESIFSFLPEAIMHPVVSVFALFVGEGWHLTLGLIFMIVVIFLPGGLVQGARSLMMGVLGGKKTAKDSNAATQPAEQGAQNMAILQVRNVSKRFGGLQALNDVNLSVDEGSVHAIIGPNGAGKSTLLNCFVGRLIPDTGTVMFDGKSLLGIKPHEINQTGVSRVFQTPEIFTDLTLLENVMIPSFASRDGAFKVNWWNRVDSEAEIREHAEAVLQEIGLYSQRNEIAGAMSRGDKRRLEMAMCLTQNPKLLLLDEPTAGMSRADTNATIDLLRKVGTSRNITKIVIEHDMHVVFSLADKISVLAQGTVIAEDVPSKIKGDPRVQEAYLGGSEE